MSIKQGGSRRIGSIPVAGSPRGPSGRDPLTNPSPKPQPSGADRTGAAPFVTPTDHPSGALVDYTQPVIGPRGNPRFVPTTGKTKTRA